MNDQSLLFAFLFALLINIKLQKLVQYQLYLQVIMLIHYLDLFNVNQYMYIYIYQSEFAMVALVILLKNPSTIEKSNPDLVLLSSYHDKCLIILHISQF